VRNVWKMLPDRTAAKYVVGYEFWSVSGFCHQQPTREGGSGMRGLEYAARPNLDQQCRQHGDGAGGCQNLLARNVWNMLPARISAKYMVGYEFWSVSRGGSGTRGMWTMLPARSGMVMISFINRNLAVSQKCIRVPWFVSRNAPKRQ
jgi:DNA gyrase/topoisomerase IV subunit B